MTKWRSTWSIVSGWILGSIVMLVTCLISGQDRYSFAQGRVVSLGFTNGHLAAFGFGMLLVVCGHLTAILSALYALYAAKIYEMGRKSTDPTGK